MGLPELWQYFHKMDGNVCLQWTVPHPARPNNQFKQVCFSLLLTPAVVPRRMHRWNQQKLAVSGSNSAHDLTLIAFKAD